MFIDDSAVRVECKPIGSLPIETFVQFYNEDYGMIVSHEKCRSLTSFYNFKTHKIDSVKDAHVVMVFDAAIVLKGGASS